MTGVPLASIKLDLHRYLQKTKTLASPEFRAVVADVTAFISAIVKDGFQKAFAQLPNFFEGLSRRPFIEVAEVIVEHHLRLVKKPEREIVRKSLLEAYTHAAGPRYVFELPGKTRLVSSLRRSGPRNFAAMLFSLHVFNVVCMTIEGKLRTKMRDVRSFDLYMLSVESICRNAVKDAVKRHGTELDERWASAVTETVEAQLLNRTTSPQLLFFTQRKK